MTRASPAPGRAPPLAGGAPAGSAPSPWLTRLAPRVRWWLPALLALAGPGAGAESLRCAGGIAAEGDSRLSVIHKCGPPQLADAFCAPVFAGSFLNPVPAPWATIVAPCQPTEDWLYERGPGNLTATVRIRGGSVLSITYGGAGR